MELLFYTDGSGDPYNISSVELSNGQPVASFKGGTSLSNSLCFLRDDYVLSALPKKSILNVFELTKRGQQGLKIPTPGVVKSLCISNDGFYLAAGIGEQIFVWNAKSGDLLASLSKHYQDVTQLCFPDDGSFLVSAGLDGLLSSWNMTDIIENDMHDSPEPFFCSSCHALPVTHVECSTIGGFNSRVYSSSLDRTIKIHDVALGVTIITLVFSKSITTFCLDSAETMIMAGAQNGLLYKVSLVSIAKTNSTSNANSVNIELENKKQTGSTSFKGHDQSVTCLVFNIDATRFVSGSADKTIKVWDIFSNQVLRSINTKDVVTNLHLMIGPASLRSIDRKPLYPFPKLSRARADSNADEKLCKILRLDQQLRSSSTKDNALQRVIDESLTKDVSEDAVTSLMKLKKEVAELHEKNKKLFDFAANNLLLD